jgi:membrane protein YqaA with SNARE-associated domain
VNKLCILVGTTIGGYVGWALPDYFGASFFVSFLVSGIGSIAGVWAGWKLARKLQE